MTKGIRPAFGSQIDLAAIDAEWGHEEASANVSVSASTSVVSAKPERNETATRPAIPRATPKKASQRKIRMPPRPEPRRDERLRGLVMPVLSQPAVAPIPMTGPPRGSVRAGVEHITAPAQDPTPAIARIEVAAIARLTSSVAGVPTLTELLLARAEARAREDELRSVAPRPPSHHAYETPILFPEWVPGPVSTRHDPRASKAEAEDSRAFFAYGTLVGAIAVGLSVLVALLLK